jgi:stage V sporulation protein B
MSKFLKGTIILVASGLVTRLLGFVNRMVMARMIGAEGVGLYMMAYPTFVLMVTFTQFGLPVAISKMVAEAKAVNEIRKIKKILAISLIITLGLSFILTPALFFGAPWIAEHFFTDNRTLYPLIAIAPVIPVVAVSSVIRGYFQGMQNMRPAAISQVIEQLVRILFIIILTRIFLPRGIHMGAAAAMAATIIGELFSFVYLMALFQRRKAFPVRRHFFHLRKGKEILKNLLATAVPAMGGRMVGSISWFLEPIVVTQSLALAGIRANVATAQYGSLTGYALPLLLLPSFMTAALGTSLVPAISESLSLKNFSAVEARLQRVIRFSLITGAVSSCILFVLAEPLMSLFYHTTEGVFFIRFMAPFFILHYLQAPLQAALQALDLARAAMINSFVGAVVKLAVIFILATKPEFGINGVALAIITGGVLVALLHFATLLKVVPLSLNLRFPIFLSVSAIVAGWAGKFLFSQLEGVPVSLSVFLSGLTIAILFIIFLFLFQVLKAGDLKNWINSLFRKPAS